MSSHRGRGNHLIMVALALLGAGCWVLPVAAADGPPQHALLRAQITAGEFAPAIALARRAESPGQRDAWLAEIAHAQAQAGMRDASLRSAAEIGDDRLRAQALSGAAPRHGAERAAPPRPTSTRSST